MQASHSWGSHKCSVRHSIARLVKPNLMPINILIQSWMAVCVSSQMTSWATVFRKSRYGLSVMGRVANASLWQFIQWKTDGGEEYTILFWFHCCPATLTSFQIRGEQRLSTVLPCGEQANVLPVRTVSDTLEHEEFFCLCLCTALPKNSVPFS